MQSDPSHNETLQLQLSSCQRQVAQLEKQLAETEKRSKSYENDWSKLFDQNKTLREENQRLQHGYESLRLQKGGFGFKMLLLSGLGGFMTAIVLCTLYIKLQPAPPYVATFERFRRDHLFDYEFKLSQGEFDAVQSSLQTCAELPEYRLIYPQIIFTQKILGAAQRHCQTLQHPSPEH